MDGEFALDEIFTYVATQPSTTADFVNYKWRVPKSPWRRFYGNIPNDQLVAVAKILGTGKLKIMSNNLPYRHSKAILQAIDANAGKGPFNRLVDKLNLVELNRKALIENYKHPNSRVRHACAMDSKLSDSEIQKIGPALLTDGCLQVVEAIAEKCPKEMLEKALATAVHKEPIKRAIKKATNSSIKKSKPAALIDGLKLLQVTIGRDAWRDCWTRIFNNISEAGWSDKERAELRELAP